MLHRFIIMVACGLPLVFAVLISCTSSSGSTPIRQVEKPTMTGSANNWRISRLGHLPSELEEISGWVFINDSVLAAINDSGNDARIYLIDTSGKILHCTELSVVNVDFEDIATDGKGHLFVADIGNNKNRREDLVIYKFRTGDLWKKHAEPIQKTHFSYADQTEFPPSRSDRKYDAEALIWRNDSLEVFTKCRTLPFTGQSFCYRIPDRSGTFSVLPSYSIKIGQRSWLNDAVTGADFSKGELILLTQDRFVVYDYSGSEPVKTSSLALLPVSQKESVAINPSGTLYICDEKQKIIGGNAIFRISKK